MILLPPRVSPQTTFFLLAGFMLLSTGCYSPTSDRSVYAAEGQPAYAKVPTALVIVMEDESTEADYQARRSEIINYLIERGYITGEYDLVGDPTGANRIIRAIVSGGGFTLSIFNQNAATGPLPDLETTDILYPADPYFISGFYYLSEIGPRRLPSRPPGYRPHPRPPHEAPPPGHPMFDHDRHWAQPGQRNRNDDRHAPPPDRQNRRDQNHPQPDHSPAPAPDKKPDNRTQPHPDNHRTPPPAGIPPKSRVNPRPDQTDHPPMPAPDKKPDNRTQSHPDNHRTPPPAGILPKPNDHPRPENNGQMPPPSTPSKNVDRSQPADVDRHQRSNPPITNQPTPVQPRPAPAPERSNDPDRKAPPADDKDRRRQEN